MNNYRSLLSIGIPTFMRNDVVADNILDLVSDNFLSENDIDLIVIDNASDDGTFDSISRIKDELPNPRNLKVFRNENNLGIFGNIFRLFEIVDSEYLIITSDEDWVLKKNIPRLLEFIRRNQPTFVSPQVFLNGSLYRGEKRNKRISERAYDAAGFYISGLVFHVGKTREVIESHLQLLTANNLYYVQNLIIAELLLKHPGTLWYYREPVTEMRYSLPTHVFYDNSHSYWSVAGRWESFLAIEEYFIQRISVEANQVSRSFLESLLRKNREKLHGWLTYAITEERPEMLADFRKGVLRETLSWEFLGKPLHWVTKMRAAWGKQNR